jgi:hypothetical protein
LTGLVWIVLTGGAAAEVVFLTNGDVIHGAIVAANNDSVTLETPYGKLSIPKSDIERIDYQDGGEPAEEGEVASERPRSNIERWRSRVPSGSSQISLQISGRSFWYAFDSPAERPADTRIRMSLFVDNSPACTFLDERPDTVDGNTLYNSFTFSPTDSQVLETADGFDCRIDEAEDGEVVLRLVMPNEVADGQVNVRMLYEINHGDRTLPSWVDAVSRSFNVEASPGRDTRVRLEQDSTALEYSGLFKKTMKNVELFQLIVLSSELR